MSTRSNLYQAARLLGHAQAVRRGRVPERVTNVVIGRLVGKILRGIWR